MLSHRIRGRLLTLTVKGRYSPDERDAFLDTIGADPAVPSRAVLMIDIRELEFNPAVGDGLRALIARIGPKLGTVCAVVASDARWKLAQEFQRAASSQQLRVVVFRDEASARDWLAPLLRG